MTSVEAGRKRHARGGALAVAVWCGGLAGGGAQGGGRACGGTREAEAAQPEEARGGRWPDRRRRVGRRPGQWRCEAGAVVANARCGWGEVRVVGEEDGAFFSGSGQVGPGRVKKVIRKGSRIAILEHLKGVLE